VGKFTQYKIQLASLPEGKYEADFRCDTEFFRSMENADVISADVNVHLDLMRRHDVYDCTFICKGMLQIPCDRCLDPIDHVVDATYHIIVKYGEEYNDESDDILIIPQSDATLNVAYMLYDTIVLTIPLRHVHPTGKCNRAMAAALQKHKGSAPIDEADIDETFDEEEIDIPAEDTAEE